MRTAKLIQIICWSIVAILLLGVLVFAIIRSVDGSRNMLSEIIEGRWDVFNDEYIYNYNDKNDGSGRYSVDGSYSIPVEGISSISIEWVSGDVNIVPYDGKEIVFSETSRRTLDDDEKLVYDVRGETLVIKFWKDRLGFVFGHFDQSKNLTVQIPAELAAALQDLRVDTVSADVVSNGLSAQHMKLNTVSGEIRCDGLTAEELELSTTSGDIEMTGSFGEIEADSVSGSIDIEDDICPTRVDVGTVSGSAEIAIPENDGFTVKYDKVSGDFECEFPITTSNNGGKYKDGGASFKMSTVSGDLNLKKLAK